MRWKIFLILLVLAILTAPEAASIFFGFFIALVIGIGGTWLLTTLIFLRINQYFLSSNKTNHSIPKECPYCFRKLDKDQVKAICPYCYEKVVEVCPNCGEDLPLVLIGGPDNAGFKCPSCEEFFPDYKFI